MNRYLFVFLALVYISIQGVYANGLYERFINFRLEDDDDSAKVDISFDSFWIQSGYKGLDLENTHSFSEVLQTIVNRINASNTDVRLVFLGKTDKNNIRHTVLLDRALVEGNSPDLFMIQSTDLGKYYADGYLEELYIRDLENHGINVSDWTVGSKKLSSVFNHVYGLPLGSDKLVWYVNIELFKKAGLVDKNGNPILPTSFEELMAQAKQMKEKTGVPYLSVDMLGLNGTRMLLVMMWQYGIDIYQSNKYVDGEIGINTFAGRLVGTDMQDFFSPENEYTVIGQSSVKLQRDFILNKSAVLVDTYSVRERLHVGFEGRFKEEKVLLTREAKSIESSDELVSKNDTIVVPDTREYAYIYPFPNIYGESYTWGTTNLIVMKKGLKTENYYKYEAALDIMKSFFDESDKWLDKGLAPTLYSDQADVAYRQSFEENDVLMSDQEVSVVEYIKTFDESMFLKENIRDIPLSKNYQDMMLTLQSMANEIIVKRNDVKIALIETEGRISDLIIRKGQSKISNE